MTSKRNRGVGQKYIGPFHSAGTADVRLAASPGREGIHDGRPSERHSRWLDMVTGTAVRAMTTIPGRERSVAEARSFVDGALGQAHPDRETARLLVSELVTN